jgi:hypothetical protein
MIKNNRRIYSVLHRDLAKKNTPFLSWVDLKKI